VRRHQRNTKYTKMDLYIDRKDNRGDTAEAVPCCPFDSINAISFIAMMNRE
jgi:hypothetical protein